jgi:hypothetical protein
MILQYIVHISTGDLDIVINNCIQCIMYNTEKI